jgi:hypothetical protein
MPRTTDVYYLTLPVDSIDQGTSLADYLTKHGVHAEVELPDGVLCPVEEMSATGLIQQLHQHWKLYWQHSDAELFGLPVFVKPTQEPSGCTECNRSQCD